MNRGLDRQQIRELRRIIGGDLPRVQVTAHPVGDGPGPRERPFHRDLLVEQHADQKGERAAAEQLVGLRLLCELDPHATSFACDVIKGLTVARKEVE
ncbi:hypothetical protein GCM10023193_47010 [Planotetraspora kaengkrachanensis]|uniref:Uncharacterized protein n=1 Tax=Planotetraspora kaengkrachanensis TaxID=575193 RepID=A0A8J3PTI5_9ACTN|nr:hypothetical protein Pka01_37700 [Planotetraspora kaengkrachanensis]